LNDIYFPTDIREAANFNYELENKKLFDYLKNHRLKDNSNVKLLIKKFEPKEPRG